MKNNNLTKQKQIRLMIILIAYLLLVPVNTYAGKSKGEAILHLPPVSTPR